MPFSLPSPQDRISGHQRRIALHLPVKKKGTHAYKPVVSFYKPGHEYVVNSVPDHTVQQKEQEVTVNFLSEGNTFQEPQWMPETMKNTEPYTQVFFFYT